MPGRVFQKEKAMFNRSKVAYVVRVDEMDDSFVLGQTGGKSIFSPFIDSLDKMTPDDIAPPDPKAKKTKGDIIFNTFRYIIMAACSIVFIVCMGYIINSMLQYKKADDYYNSLSDGLFDDVNDGPNKYYSSVGKLAESSKSLNLYNYDTYIKNLGSSIPAVSIIDSSYNLQFERLKAKLREMYAQNSDIYGWIKIDGTNVNYPLVKGTDNTWYLDHGTNKEFLKVGSIFVDYRCGKTIANNPNTVIYGHNMANDTMFSQVDKYIKSEEFFRNTNIVIYTFDGIYTYEPFAAFATKSNYPYFRTDFSSGEDLLAFAETMKSNSLWKKDVTLSPDDKLITLSTCDNITEPGRYAVHAKLVSIER